MSYSTGFQQNALSLNGISILSDGYITIENGNINNLNNLDLTTLSTNEIAPQGNTLTVGQLGKNLQLYGENILISSSTAVEITTVSTNQVTPQGNTLTVGEIGKNLQLYGDNILISGNTVIESVNVEFSDHNLLLNYGGSDLLLEGSGVSVCGDNNEIKASLVLDSSGDWSVSSVNNKLSVENIVCGNITISNPLTYDNFEAGNITASNKFIGPNNSVLNQIAVNNTAVSHLNAGTLLVNNKCQVLGELKNKNNFDLSTMRALNQPQNGFFVIANFMIQWGTIPDSASQSATFDPPYYVTPYSVQVTRTETGGGSTGGGAVRIFGLSNTGFSIDSVTGSADKSSCYWLAIGQILV